MKLTEFIARQLNDHHESPSGVEQPTYTEWSKSHIEEAIQLASLYLFSLIPQSFTSVKTHITQKSDCIISFCDIDDCHTFVELLTVNIDGTSIRCKPPRKFDVEVNNLTSLLNMSCSQGVGEVTPTYSTVDSAPCIVRFDEPLPANTELTYVCANPPDVDNIEVDGKYSKYVPLIADLALWWLYRTDTESRSNLARAEMHYTSARDFITNILLLEFSLREDGYNFGRRKVEGSDVNQ